MILYYIIVLHNYVLRLSGVSTLAAAGFQAPPNRTSNPWSVALIVWEMVRNPAKFIILNAMFLVIHTQFLVFDTKFISFTHLAARCAL